MRAAAPSGIVAGMLSTEPLDDLRQRLRGEILSASDPGWDAARQAWNLVADQRPVLVALPEDAADIAAVVAYARDNGMRVAPQGTGHNAAPLRWDEDTVLLATSRMRGV
jgi:FAD/FMN-containing dehydrogenase